MSNPEFHDDRKFADDSPFEQTSDVPTDGPESNQRPQNLTFICILAMLLGGVGLLAGCVGLVSQAFAAQIQKLSVLPPGADNPAAEAQAKMNAKMMAVTERYKWVTLPLMVLKLFVEGALLIGAIMAMGLKPHGRTWLLAALIGALILESIHVVPVILVQSETVALVREMIPAQQGANRPAPGETEVANAIFSVIGIGTIVMTLGWLALKAVFYVIGIRYLRKPAVVALFPRS